MKNHTHVRTPNGVRFSFKVPTEKNINSVQIKNVQEDAGLYTQALAALGEAGIDALLINHAEYGKVIHVYWPLKDKS